MNSAPPRPTEEVTINLNSYVRVRLSGRGKEYYARNNGGKAPRLEADGSYRTQFWIFIAEFGGDFFGDPLDTVDVIVEPLPMIGECVACGKVRHLRSVKASGMDAEACWECRHDDPDLDDLHLEERQAKEAWAQDPHNEALRQTWLATRDAHAAEVRRITGEGQAASSSQPLFAVLRMIFNG